MLIIIKSLIIVIYAVVSVIAWNKRYYLIGWLLPSETSGMYLLFKILFQLGVLILLVFVGLWIYEILFIKTKYVRKFNANIDKTDLKNAKNERPLAKRSKKDKNKDHGIILKVLTRGNTIAEFRNVILQLENILNVKIYDMEYSKKTKYIFIYAVPMEYIKDKIISSSSTEILDAYNYLITGSTGSGKSTAINVFMSIYGLNLPLETLTSEKFYKMYILDYKQDKTFSKFRNTKNYFAYNDVTKGFETIESEMQHRQEQDPETRDKYPIIVIFDEYVAWINSMDKKDMETYKKRFANMLFLARNLNIRIIVGIQRADASNFSVGSRDQFKNILGLGKLSKEAKEMLFADLKEEAQQINPTGFGYLFQDGKEHLDRVRIQMLNEADQARANRNIIIALNN